MYRRYFSYISYTLVLAGAWTILNEQPSWPVFLAGVAVAVLVLNFTARVLQPDPPLSLHHLSPWTLVRYLVTLVLQIYQSGILAISKVIRREETVRIERYESQLADELAFVMLANAVTLTPGTVTVETEGRTLLILCFAPDDPAKPSGIRSGIQKIERILLGKSGKQVKK